MGILSSGVKSMDSAFLHLTLGIGEPTATHVKFIEAPSITSSTLGGGIVKEGATLRTNKRFSQICCKLNKSELTSDVKIYSGRVVRAQIVFGHAFVFALIVLLAVEDVKWSWNRNPIVIELVNERS